MASTTFSLNFATLNSPIIHKGQKILLHDQFPKSLSNFSYHKLKHHHLLTCKAASSSSLSSTSSIMEYDLYDLLGIDSSSDQSQIKRAYRSLQKRCHPDIAGLAGHDMAIILNEAYAVLSDPISRYVYDKERAKLTELQGYTGRPMYSVWLGPESEQRAIFVDEIRCVGCLKCALLAEKTFAIESTYGRARVVSQWADPEDKIQAAIDACPVDCISTVDRSDLAALEFLMSKQPRGKVRIGASNTAGARTFDVFSELKFFQKRLEEAATKKSNQDSKYSDIQRDARMSAIQTIRSISNWLYWQHPTSDTSLSLTLREKNISRDPDIEKLRNAAAAARKHGMFKTRANAKVLSQETKQEEYWVPSTPVLPLKIENKSYAQTRSKTPSYTGVNRGKAYMKRDIKPSNPLISGIPIGLGVVAAITVGLQGPGEAVGGLDRHIGGSFAQQVVNSFGMQVMLAGVTWYLIGSYVIGVVGSLSRKD
ncbi:chaperone protein dnaJ C76, chloroplastic-like [Chenopodium quinoa]|uniref:J domain-containing protein n=1 Tax=Chenopodium quinoa TaxID=63459 RepID=A0A803MNX0_CHEQI|nr:chaperone protein dnaJ C76, chloroplastic-like [Chenopodium quinoa]